MISNWIVFITLEIRQFTWPYQNNFGQPAILPTLIYKCKWIYHTVNTITLPNSDEMCHIWLRLIPIPAECFFLTLVQCFPSQLTHIGLQFSLQSCIETVIRLDISNIAILARDNEIVHKSDSFHAYLSHFKKKKDIAQINMPAHLGSITENWKAGPACLFREKQICMVFCVFLVKFDVPYQTYHFEIVKEVTK